MLSDQEIAAIASKPPAFVGEVTKGANENASATIRKPGGGSVRAIAVGAPILGGNVAVFEAGGRYYAFGQGSIQVRERRLGLGINSLPAPDDETQTPVYDSFMLSLWVIRSLSTTGSGFDTLGTETYEYWLTDGVNSLKVFEFDPVTTRAGAGTPVSGNNGTLNNVLHTYGLNNGTAGLNPYAQDTQRTRLHIVAPNLFVIQVIGHKFEYNPFGIGILTNAAVNTIIVRDWQVISSTLTFDDPDSDPFGLVTYPAELDAYSQYLTPRISNRAEGASTREAYITSLVIEYPDLYAFGGPLNYTGTAPEFFAVTRANDSEPIWATWTDQGADSIWLPGRVAVIDPPQALGAPHYAYVMLFLRDRTWDFTRRDLTFITTDIIPRPPFDQMPGRLHSFTDGLIITTFNQFTGQFIDTPFGDLRSDTPDQGLVDSFDYPITHQDGSNVSQLNLCRFAPYLSR